MGSVNSLNTAVGERLQDGSRGSVRLHKVIGGSSHITEVTSSENTGDIKDKSMKGSANLKRSPLWLFVRR